MAVTSMLFFIFRETGCGAHYHIEALAGFICHMYFYTYDLSSSRRLEYLRTCKYHQAQTRKSQSVKLFMVAGKTSLRCRASAGNGRESPISPRQTLGKKRFLPNWDYCDQTHPCVSDATRLPYFASHPQCRPSSVLL